MSKLRRPRSKRWAEAANTALSALEDLRMIQEEFEGWRDNLPENLQSSMLGEKLNTVCDIDLQSAIDAADEACNADLPLGYGRD